MITTKSSQDGLTFRHNGDPEGSELLLVLDPSKIKTEFDNFGNTAYLTITLEYEAIRDFVLEQLKRREIEKIENMDGDKLAAYFTGDWEKLDELQGRR